MNSALPSHPVSRLRAAPPWGDFAHAHHRVSGLNMHVASLGAPAPDRPAIVMLHGFPDLWCVWAKVMAGLEGFACYAPDQRGYNLTDRPSLVEDYHPDKLLGDVLGLVEAIGQGRPVVLAGHDWGGVLAAWFAARHPALVERLILVNTTHPKAFQDALWSDPKQRAASAYIDDLRSGTSQAQWLAEGPEALFEAWTAPARASGTIDVQEADLYRAAWADPAAWTAMVNWYRASPFEVNVGPSTSDWTSGQNWMVTAPTLLIWGENDPVFTPELRASQSGWFQDITHIGLQNTGHNPLRDAPDAVIAAITSFLS